MRAHFQILVRNIQLFFKRLIDFLSFISIVIEMAVQNNIMNANRESIYRYVLEGIAKGRYNHNDRIPTEQELCEMFSTHRLNAHYAVKQLQEMGVLRRNRKQGTFVEKIPTPFQMGELQSLATRRVCVLNTIHPEYQHIHWNQRLITTFEDSLRDHQVDVQFENVSEMKSVQEYRDFMSDLIAHGFNALVLIPHFGQDSSNPISTQPELLFEFHNNVFIFDRGVHHWNNWPYNIVSINVFGEGALVAQYLIEQKTQHIVFCGQARQVQSWQYERYNGLAFGLYRETQGQQSLIRHNYLRSRSNPDFFENICKLIKQGRTALVAENDETAVAIHQEAVQHNLVAGKDYALVGFDDNSKYQSLNLTTVSPSLERIGQTLAQMIYQSLDRKANNTDVICTRVNSELKIRATG